MIVDSHVHVGGPPVEAEPEKFVALMEKHRIERAVVFRYFYKEPTATSNLYISKTASNYPKRLIGFAWVNPNESTAVSELRKSVEEWNLKGLKLHLEMHPSPLNILRGIFREAERLSIPICVHLGDDFDCIEKLSKEFDVNVIIAHLGTGVYRLEIDRLKKAIKLAELENVFLETSGNTYPLVDYALRATGASKLILGSDYPHEHPIISAKIVQLLDISDLEKELILSKNIMNLLSI